MVVVDGEVTGDMDGEKCQGSMLGVQVVALFRATVCVSAFVERVGVVQHQGHDAAVARSTFGESVVQA
jgi:hypothetical protein